MPEVLLDSLQIVQIFRIVENSPQDFCQAAAKKPSIEWACGQLRM